MNKKRNMVVLQRKKIVKLFLELLGGGKVNLDYIRFFLKFHFGGLCRGQIKTKVPSIIYQYKL